MDESKHRKRSYVSLVIALSFLAGMITALPVKAIDLPSDAWIKGNVSDGVDPIPNSYVKVMMFTAGGVDVNWTYSDELGDYEIGVPGGFDYMIFAANGSYMMGMSQLSILAGETKWVNFSLESIAPTVADVTIKGFVKDSMGLPRDDGHVLGIVYDPMGDDMPEYANVTVPEADGYFEVNVIPGTGGGGAVAMDFEGYQMIENSSDDPLVSGQAYWFNITLEMPSYNDDAMLYGYVTVSGSGLPLENALVAVEIWNEELEDDYSNYTFTDAAGYYEMNVSNGSARLMISKGGYSMAMYEIEIPHDALIQQDAELSETNCIVRGNVTDSKSTDPIQFVTVFMWHSADELFIANTNESGFYEMRCVDGENLYMTVELDGYSRGAAEIDLSPGDAKWQDFGLWPVSAWIEGYVTDFFGGGLIENARVEASSEGYYYEESYTDSLGYYNLSVPQGTYEVRVSAFDYRENESSVEVIDEMATKHDVKLLPQDIPESCKFHGWVNDTDSGLGIGNARVEVELPDGSYSKETRSDTDGSYEIYIPAVEIKYLVTAYKHYPAYGVLDAELLLDQRMDFSLDADIFGPNMTYTQTPVENLTWFNPTVIDIEVEDPNMETFMLFQSMFWKTEGDWEYFNLIDMKSTSFNPLDPHEGEGLPYVLTGDNYTILEEWDATIPSAGWLQSGVDSQYVIASEQWWGPTHYYAIWGYYTNASLTDAPCSAYFDADTGEIQMLWLDGDVEVEPGDPSATFNTEVATFGYDLSDWSDWPTMDSMLLGPLDVEDMIFVLDETAPSGRYRTLFVASDFGEQPNMFMTNLTVDNDPPVANAGPNRGEVVNTTIELNASLSTDIGWIDSYLWEFDDGGPISLSGVVAEYMFTLPGEYEILLTVTDGAGHTDSDILVITVNADMPPTADAGPDMVVAEDVPVSFDGVGSSDDVDIVNYTWIIVELNVTLYDEVCNYTFADPGIYTLELVVNDTIGQASEPDSATITVEDVTPPVADAGLDMEAPIGAEVTLNGSLSSDANGIVSYTWTFTDGNEQELSGETVTYTFANPGEHTVTLEVEDAAGNSDTDTVLVTITDDIDPEADAGPDQTVDIGEEVTFDGSGSSDNSGIIENYTWTFEYDDDERQLYGIDPKFTFEIGGEYLVMLTIEDAVGNYDTDTVTIRVNSPPDADAGPDQTVDIGEEVTFDGSGSSDNSGTIENYTWTFVYDGEEEELYGVSPSFVFEIAGEYTVELTVTDAVGLTDTDEVVITVEEADGGADEESFLESYWWVLAIIAIVVVAGAASAAMIMSKKGGKGDVVESKPEETDDLPPPPDDL